MLSLRKFSLLKDFWSLLPIALPELLITYRILTVDKRALRGPLPSTELGRPSADVSCYNCAIQEN